ncbi:hypothetical protein ACFFF5_07435 [Lederbergia wuyishanensis]|uniref:Uncharacterized protein n=1 Tax=Lederbergia wuyishanensis TaxID=1347903 RepID=A0ABU0D276_9BACI|nr:hypothetical protein [Lederbergia wuyishanensis]MCJ8007321.1 hypothetical protein [Lederbergia wuyishanensis]MDQ0342515.1 hypothetical protein [Lederbergia wuyishanensis]
MEDKNDQIVSRRRVSSNKLAQDMLTLALPRTKALLAKVPFPDTCAAE